VVSELARASWIRLLAIENTRNCLSELVLDPFKAQIKQYLAQGVPIASIQKIINPQLEKPLTYNSYKYYVQHDPELVSAQAGISNFQREGE